MKTLLSAAIMVAATASAADTLILNELMQSNIDCIMDDLNEFPDSWVELHNPTDTTANLADYSLGISGDSLSAYRLPDITVDAGGYVVVYCDKESTGLHTDFRLESGKGGSVYLYKNDSIVDAIEGMVKMPSPNVAFGRVEGDDSGAWAWMLSPTPGAVNSDAAVGVLGDPVFDTPGRVSSSPLTLTISLPSGAPAGTEIRYTTDGTEPVESSRLFNANGIRISTTTNVRAKLFCAGWASPRSVTQSYIFHPRTMTLPVISIVTDRNYFYDNSIGIFVEGNDSNDPNYGHDWRRPINIEMFEAENQPSVINQLCETRVKGNATRVFQMKSLVLYANKRFGTKRFEYEFFPSDAPGLTEWKSIELRNAGNDFDYLYLRDAVIQHVMGTNVDLDWQRWQPAIIYINGTYDGIRNIRTRSNEDYVYTFYDGLEDIDMFENWYQLKAGTYDSLHSFMAFYAEEGHTLAEYDRLMDTREFANLMIMNLFYLNTDFPGNNIMQWRPTADDGRWRWIAKDTDFGLGLYGRDVNYKVLHWLHDTSYDPSNTWGNAEYATRLFRSLEADPDFETLFIDLSGAYMGDFLNYRGTVAALDSMINVIKAEYTYHRALINPWWPDYNQEAEAARKWVKNRTEFFYDHLADFYGLNPSRQLTIDTDRTDDMILNVNGHRMNHRDFDGRWWEGRRLTVSGLSSDSLYMTTGWEVKITANGRTTTEQYDTPVLDIEFPECQSVAITSYTGVNALPEIIADTTADIDPNSPVEVWDLSGRNLGKYADLPGARRTLDHGLYIITQPGHKATKYRF